MSAKAPAVSAMLRLRNACVRGGVRSTAERSRRIKLRTAAIAALPEELRAEAMTVDMDDFPVWRQAAGTEIVVTYEEAKTEEAKTTSGEDGEDKEM